MRVLRCESKCWDFHLRLSPFEKGKESGLKKYEKLPSAFLVLFPRWNQKDSPTKNNQPTFISTQKRQGSTPPKIQTTLTPLYYPIHHFTNYLYFLPLISSSPTTALLLHTVNEHFHSMPPLHFVKLIISACG